MQSAFEILKKLFVFCLVLYLEFSSYGQPFNQNQQYISGLLEKIEREHRIVDELADNNLTNLPIGIRKTISGTTITIGIDSAILTSRGMIINAYTQIKLPGTIQPVSFALRGAIITPSGLSQQGPIRLELIAEHKISFSRHISLILPSDRCNYIDWDCSGFRSVSFNGFFEFSAEVFLPDPELSKSDKVIAGFSINTTDLNNILISTSITPFRINGLGDIAFAVKNASVDMSDFVNCEEFVFPKGYNNIFEDAPQLWRGFFLKEVNVFLPSELSSALNRSEISASNLLIDEFGLSGHIVAGNILPIELGSASGWPFSITSLAFGFSKNKLSEGEISGLIGVPFLGDETLLYNAQVVTNRNGLEYNFSVKTTDSKDYSVPFGGTVRLDKGCIFRMKTGNGKFIPSAILNGLLYIREKHVNMDGIRFENLLLTAESPYITGGKFDVAGGAGFKLAGFGLSIDSISILIKSGKASIGVHSKLALMNKTDKGVSADTRFFINALVEHDRKLSSPYSDRQKWVYDGILLQGVRIKGSVSVFSFSGNINTFNDHPVFGDGFNGSIGLTVNKIIKDTARVEIYFGTKTDFKYWFAKIDIPVDIPLGAVTLNNIGGGAYSNMERVSFNAINSDYIPKKDAGIGLLAQVGLYVKSREIFNADASFEIAINKSGGVKFIRFSGDGRFFSKGEGNAHNDLARVSASINMVFDNVNDSFHANLNVYMNIANAIKGVGPDGLLGEAVIHCDPDDWYIYIGRPSYPLGVEVLGLLKTQTYFMTGTKIEDMPLPPSEVSSIIQNTDMDFMRDERSIATGKGVAFGIQFKAAAGVGEEKGFVYAYFSAGAGADIMLQNYGSVRCEGRSGPIGINGWYASGQGYAYLTGKIGIRVKKAEFDIMSVAAALLVQAKMPNPSWFRGNIAARYSILGGLIRGKVNVVVTLGEECVMMTTGEELGELNLIGDIMPANGSKEVDVFTAPQVSFNTTIDKEFGMINLNDQYAIYRVRLDQFDLIATDNQIITSNVEWNANHDLATLKLLNIMPGKEHITASVKVHIEKKSGSGWKAITGEPEMRQVNFNTGDEPKSIPESIVAYSYPLKNQYNFYKAEYPNGYIKLSTGLANLFRTESQGTKWEYIVRFSTDNGISETSVTYNNLESMVNYHIPDNLISSSVYEMTIIKKSVSEGLVDRNLTRNEVIMSTVSPEDSLRILQTKLTGTIAGTETETSLYTLSFRTSMHSTFSGKLAAISGWRDQSAVDNKNPDRTYMSLLYIRASLDETFDKYETEGSGSDIKPLVYIEGLRGANWLDSHIHPLIYEYYGTGGLTVSRNTNDLGVFPLRATYISNINEDGYVLSGNESNPKKGDIYIKYFIPHYVGTDFADLLNKAVARYLDKVEILPVQAQRLIKAGLKIYQEADIPSE